MSLSTLFLHIVRDELHSRQLGVILLTKEAQECVYLEIWCYRKGIKIQTKPLFLKGRDIFESLDLCIFICSSKLVRTSTIRVMAMLSLQWPHRNQGLAAQTVLGTNLSPQPPAQKSHHNLRQVVEERDVQHLPRSQSKTPLVIMWIAAGSHESSTHLQRSQERAATILMFSFLRLLLELLFV